MAGLFFFDFSGEALGRIREGTSAPSEDNEAKPQESTETWED